MRPLLLALLALPLLAQEPGDDNLTDDPRRELARAELEQRRILEELTGLEQELLGIEDEIDALRARADEVEQQRLLHEDELARAQALVDQRAERIGRLLRALYRIEHRGFARVVFSAEDPADLRRRSRYLLSIIRAAEAETRSFREQVTLKEAAVSQVDADREAVAALMAELRLKEAHLRDERARRQALLDEVRGRRALALQVLSERNASARQLNQSLALTTSGASSDATPFRDLHGRLRWPVSGGRLLRGFGNYTDPATGTTVRSLGVDIAAPKHTPVRAVASGTVTFQDWVNGMGRTVVLGHGDYSTVYSHCNEVKVRRGQSVGRDDVIGTVGETGVTDTLGPRVHFEVRYHNTPQDPIPWLRSRE
ncbi:MAG: peptidoglycan DD-metalloendopeptidase family protein [Alphaproteobacteria bacterium]|nr:peptidoglycan DD-metalloendopeptidase family protein [Alphaproteobacteria bacterium]